MPAPSRVLAPCLALLAGGALMFSGCGNARTQVPDPSAPVAPTAFRTLTYAADRVALSAPANWVVSQTRAPLVSILSSGNAIVALWRFPRTAAVPIGTPALRQALSALIALSRRRDPTLRVIRAKVMSFDRAPAIEVDAFQHIDGQLRRVRSLHVFVGGAEVVLEQYAPPASFHLVDHEVFSPVRRSLRLLTRG